MRHLLERKFDQIPTPASLEDVIERGVPMVMVQRAIGGNEELLLAIEFEVIKTMGRLNLNPALTLKPGQSPQIAKVIYETFRTESLGDLKLAFEYGAAGLYGEIFRLDGAVLVKWIQCYLEQKYAAVEQVKQREKEKQRQDDNFNPKEFYSKAKAWEDRKKEIEDEKKKIAYEERQKDALYRMQQLSEPTRPTFICDGIEVTAINEHYARLAYKNTFDKEPESVAPKTVGPTK